MKKKKKRQKDEFWIEIYRIPQSWASHVSINKITIQLFHIQNDVCASLLKIRIEIKSYIKYYFFPMDFEVFFLPLC